MFMLNFAEIANPLTELYAGPDVKETAESTVGTSAPRNLSQTEGMSVYGVGVGIFRQGAEIFLHTDASDVSTSSVLTKASRENSSILALQSQICGVGKESEHY